MSTQRMSLRDVPPGAEFEFRLEGDNDNRRWHVTTETRVVSIDRRGRSRKPCPDAIRVMSRQGATRWLPPSTVVTLLEPIPNPDRGD